MRRDVLAVERAEGVARRLLDGRPLVVHTVGADGEQRRERLKVLLSGRGHARDDDLAHLLVVVEDARRERADELRRKVGLLDDELDRLLDGGDAHLPRDVLNPAKEGRREQAGHLLRDVALGQQEERPEQPRAVESDLLVLHRDDALELREQVGNGVGRHLAQLEQDVLPLVLEL